MFKIYNPARFKMSDETQLCDFVRAYPFATLISTGASGVIMSHLPLHLDQTKDGSALKLSGHVARANDHWKEIENGGDGVETLALFHGPQAYVTPQWYSSKLVHAKVVPTWNYAVVHVKGSVRTISEPAWLHAHLTQLTDEHESQFAHQWKVTDAPEDFVDKMMGAIVGLEMTVTHMEGKWKLSQNRDEADRNGVTTGLGARDNADSQAVHEMMKAD